MRQVLASEKRDPSKFYGAPFLPVVNRGVLWECDSREEYLRCRGLYEESEGNCNTCRHLERVKQEKDPTGWMQGICTRVHFRPVIKFHPEDPMQVACWESRRT